MAVTEDREAATAIGIDPQRVYLLTTFIIGAILAALGGALASPTTSLLPGIGTDMIVLSFAVAATAGLGQIEGTAVTALMIGLARAFAIYTYPEFEVLVPYLMMVSGVARASAGPVRNRKHEKDLMRRLASSYVRRAARASPPRSIAAAVRRPASDDTRRLILAKGIVVLGIIVLLQAGQVSFGHAMFFAVGAYAVAFYGRYLGTGDLVLYLVLGSLLGGMLSGLWSACSWCATARSSSAC